MVTPAAKPIIFATVFSTALMYKPLLPDLPMYRFISELLLTMCKAMKLITLRL